MANYEGVMLQGDRKREGHWRHRMDYESGGGVFFCMAGELWASVFGLLLMRSSLAAIAQKSLVGTTAVWTSGMSAHSGLLSPQLS